MSLIEAKKTLQGDWHEAKEQSVQRSRIVRCLEVRLKNRELLSVEQSHIGFAAKEVFPEEKESSLEVWTTTFVFESHVGV